VNDAQATICWELTKPPSKPRLRGVSHQLAWILSLVAAIVLWREAAGPRATQRGLVYACSMAAMFGISALYHVPHCPPAPRLFLRRLDHSAIFLLIAGSYTAISLVVEPPWSTAMLWIAWVGAAAGIGIVVFWPWAPKPIRTGIYLAVSWAIVPFMPRVYAGVGPVGLALLAAGGACYTVGAIIYARRHPNPWPHVFGYHEIFTCW